MLDYLRNLTKSDEEKRQEMLTAYLDNELTLKQQRQIESELAHDDALSAELDQMRTLQQQMRQLPQRRVRRNFTLDPALYGRPQREPLLQAYPVLRTATVLAAFLFIFALAANIFLAGAGGTVSDAQSLAMQAESEAQTITEGILEESEAAEAPIAPEAIEEAAEEESSAEEMVVIPSATMPAAETITELPLELETDLTGPNKADAAPVPEEEEVAGEDRAAMIVVPTAGAEGTDIVEQPAELLAVETATAIVSKELSESQPATIISDDELTMEAALRQAEGNGRGPFASSLGSIVLILGIIFLVLIFLTLLARRRL